MSRLLLLTLALITVVVKSEQQHIPGRQLQSLNDPKTIEIKKEKEEILKVDNFAAELVKGRCVELRSTSFNPKWDDISGFIQWGNYMIYYYTALMFIVQAGASSVKMPPQEVAGLDNIRGITYRPLNSTSHVMHPSDDCLFWHPLHTFLTSIKEYGSMQDLYDFREQWITIMGTEQPNPFVPDFGIQPSMEIASSRMDIPWKDVIVLHVRGGDAHALANRGGYMGHMQPPCSYYEDIVETGYDNGKAFPYVLVITSRKITNFDAEGINPCAAYIEDRYRSGSHATQLVDYNELAQHLSSKTNDIKHIGIRVDLFILSNAVNLAEGHSTFTMGTNLLNYQLQRHFVPAGPATINSFRQMKKSNGSKIEYTRQYYSESITQVQYLMPGWFDYDASCAAMTKGTYRYYGTWLRELPKIYKQHQNNHTTLSDLMLEYPRSSLVKFVTSNEPFRCNGVELNPHWYAPCVCDNDVSEVAKSL